MGLEEGKAGGATKGAKPPSSPRKVFQWVSDRDWRFLLLLFSSVSLLLLFSLSSSAALRQIPSFVRRSSTTTTQNQAFLPSLSADAAIRKSELTRSRIAVCLVGGARRFELTGPSILDRILDEYPNADLFLNSPLDPNSFKLSLLKFASRVASFRVFKPSPIPETESQVRVLTAANSPNGIQGLLQYFSLVEGCLTMIESYQKEKGFTYDWIVRTRVDGYWSAPLDPNSFVGGEYVVPPGSSFGGLNDRLGIGDYNSSVVALSRLSLIPTLDSMGYMGLNSETAFRAQLTTHNISFRTLPQPFCIVTDRKYTFPPSEFGVPVAALSSMGPLSGAKCRPCKPVCTGPCVADIMLRLQKGWSWMPWTNGTVELCDAAGEWEEGWEGIFDGVVGETLAQFRKRIGEMDLNQCIEYFEELKEKTTHWEAPTFEEMCRLGLDPKYSHNS
uniref:DUF7796 domain-containing protein n=1 Tax=Opuntia streptacantha TaxID=393608 RepID=A0A7C9CV18_OPUST